MVPQAAGVTVSGDLGRQALASTDAGGDSSGAQAKPVPVPSTLDARKRSEDDAFATIKVARKIDTSDDATSEKTKADYARKLKQITSAAKKLSGSDGDKLFQVLAMFASKSGSFYAYRAALSWSFKLGLRVCLAEQDRMQTLNGRGDAWLAQVAKLPILMRRLKAVEAMTLKDARDLTGRSAERRESKRLHLAAIGKRYPLWKQQMLDAMAGSVYESGLWAMALTGCRSEELEMGLTLTLDGARVVATIQGAKLGPKSGQPWRKVSLHADAIPEHWLTELSASGELHIRIDNKDKFRKTVERRSKRYLRDVPIASPYVFRHALVESLRDDDWTAEEIAAAIGHSVSETQAMYGRRQSGGGKRPPIRAALVRGATQTARPVRGLDRSALEKIVDGKAKKSSPANSVKRKP